MICDLSFSFRFSSRCFWGWRKSKPHADRGPASCQKTSRNKSRKFTQIGEQRDLKRDTTCSWQWNEWSEHLSFWSNFCLFASTLKVFLLAILYFVKLLHFCVSEGGGHVERLEFSLICKNTILQSQLQLACTSRSRSIWGNSEGKQEIFQSIDDLRRI